MAEQKSFFQGFFGINYFHPTHNRILDEPVEQSVIESFPEEKRAEVMENFPRRTPLTNILDATQGCMYGLTFTVFPWVGGLTWLSYSGADDNHRLAYTVGMAAIPVITNFSSGIFEAFRSYRRNSEQAV